MSLKYNFKIYMVTYYHIIFSLFSLWLDQQTDIVIPRAMPQSWLKNSKISW